MIHERMYDLAEHIRQTQMTQAERDAQRVNFVFGNCNIENPQVTREVVLEAARRLKERKRAKTHA